MVGLKNWMKSSRILQFLSKLVLQNNLIAHYCFFKQITEMSICHCLSVKKRVSVKNVKILEMSDFGNTELFRWIRTNWRHFHTPYPIGAMKNSKRTSRRFYRKCFCLWTMKRRGWVPCVSFNSWIFVLQRDGYIADSCQSVVVSSPSSTGCFERRGVVGIDSAVQFLHYVWRSTVLLCRLLEKCILTIHSDEVCDSIHSLLRVFQNNRFSLPLVFFSALLDT